MIPAPKSVCFPQPTYKMSAAIFGWPYLQPENQLAQEGESFLTTQRAAGDFPTCGLELRLFFPRISPTAIATLQNAPQSI